MTIPKHVLWFQVLLYLSLVLDALSVAFQDRTPTAAITETTIMATSVISAFGVRSWNATDNASSVSDKYSSTSNHNTFLGKVIEGAGYPVGLIA